MFEAFLVTTSSEGLRALGSAPQRSYELVAGTVRAELGDRHAALFAEPVTTDFGDRFDWYATVPGKARRVADLGADAAAAVVAARATLESDIRALAARIAARGTPDDLRLSEALTNALVVPDASNLWAVEGPDGLAPVLVNWAWEGDALAAVRGNLGGTDGRAAARARAGATVAAASTPVAAAAAPVAAGPDTTGAAGAGAWLWGLLWLGWLGLALILAAILWLMIAACGLSPSFLPNFCPAPAAAAPAAPAASQVLEDEIARLMLRIADADRACQPPPPPPPPPPAPVAAPPPAPALPDPAPPAVLPTLPVPPTTPRAAAPSEIDRRLNDAGARRGRLQFSLAWNSRSDLDLHVSCPGGGQVFYGNRQGCGGELDIDMNAGGQRSNTPIENAYFSAPPAGQYRVRVNLFSSATRGAPEPFQLQIRDGDRVVVLQGSVAPGSPDRVFDHTHGGN